jgi:DNA-binding MarR family transcriptional regulator
MAVPLLARLRTLLDKWEAFETQGGGDLKAFALWLYHTESDLTNKIADNTTNTQQPDKQPTTFTQQFPSRVDLQEGGRVVSHGMPTENRIAMLQGKLSRYARLYIRKALHGLPIHSAEEFTFLMGVNDDSPPTKTELISLNILETSTGSEIIKRLLRAGLMTELQDPRDRRVRRLALTESGKAVRNEAYHRMAVPAMLVTANLSEEMKTQLVAMLDYLDAFHNQIWHEAFDEPLDALADRYLLEKVPAYPFATPPQA